KRTNLSSGEVCPKLSEPYSSTIRYSGIKADSVRNLFTSLYLQKMFAPEPKKHPSFIIKSVFFLLKSFHPDGNFFAHFLLFFGYEFQLKKFPCRKIPFGRKFLSVVHPLIQKRKSPIYIP
ncbi:hypothetical protein, partial [Bacillus mycoides]|uniref:hypothetical protein n=1 Tax=Bacillus mycoides TaxID=1405 RepID=UPI001F47731B